MTNANNNAGPRMSMRLTANIRPGTVSDANYSGHLSRIRRKMEKFTPTMNGEARVGFADDLLKRANVVVVNHDWADTRVDQPPNVIEGQVVRTSNGVGLIWWPAEYVFVVIDGMPSLSVGAKVRLSYRTHETQKMKAAKKVGAKWVFSELQAEVEVTSVDGQALPAAQRPKFPAFVLNQAFYEPAQIEAGTIGKITQ